MRFTEHELTAALTGAAKSVVAAQRKDVRKGRADIETVWAAMTRYERFQVLDALGDQVLPVLVALPDVEVAAGTRPTYTDGEVGEVVAGLVGDERRPGAARRPGQGPHRAGPGRARPRAAASRPGRPAHP